MGWSRGCFVVADRFWDATFQHVYNHCVTDASRYRRAVRSELVRLQPECLDASEELKVLLVLRSPCLWYQISTPLGFLVVLVHAKALQCNVNWILLTAKAVLDHKTWTTPTRHRAVMVPNFRCPASYTFHMLCIRPPPELSHRMPSCIPESSPGYVRCSVASQTHASLLLISRSVLMSLKKTPICSNSAVKGNISGSRRASVISANSMDTPSLELGRSSPRGWGGASTPPNQLPAVQAVPIYCCLCHYLVWSQSLLAFLSMCVRVSQWGRLLGRCSFPGELVPSGGWVAHGARDGGGVVGGGWGVGGVLRRHPRPPHADHRRAVHQRPRNGGVAQPRGEHPFPPRL